MLRTDIVNLTPHAIVIRVDGIDHTIPPSGMVARVETIEEVIPPFSLDDASTICVPGIVRRLGKVILPDNLPADCPVIVSSMVLEALAAQKHPLRLRAMAPDTGPTAIREGGQVKAVTRLVCA